MRLTFALTLLLAGAVSSARADEVDCSAGALRTADQLTLNFCAGREADRSDRVLNAAYGRLAGRLDADGRARLKTAEPAWIARRDATCEVEATSTAGGSMHPMEIADCQARAGRQREAQLRRYLTCAGHGGCRRRGPQGP